MKAKLILNFMSNDSNNKNDMVLVQKWAENVFKNVTMVTKDIDMLYLSNGAR